MSVAAGTAAAATTTPFQVGPQLILSFGAPSRSECVVTTGEQPGVVVVSGGDFSTPTPSGRGWGCLNNAAVHWFNLTTGVGGVAQTSDGLFGRPAEATLHTGAGQVAVMVNGSRYTPGFTTVFVP